MPSKKIITILIICIGLVVSVWFVVKKQKSLSQLSPKKNGEVTVVSPIQIDKTDYDWKKIITNIDTKEQKNLTTNKNSTITEEDTTLTDQMSRDFLSQYLMAVKQGVKVTPEVANKIALNTLSLPEYSGYTGAVYLRENLKVTSKNDKETMVFYRDTMNEILKSVYFNVKDDPIVVLVNSLTKEDEQELKKLDPIIALNKQTIKYLLGIQVPESALKVHLDLLNVSSAILADLEAMRVAVSDPARSYSAISRYSTNLNAFTVALANLNAYLLISVPK